MSALVAIIKFTFFTAEENNYNSFYHNAIVHV